MTAGTSSIEKRWAAFGGGALAALVAPWLAHIAGVPLPPLLARLMVLAAAGLALFAVGGATLAEVRAREPERRRAIWLLLLLVAISFVLRFVGLAFELIDHFHNDEGIFLETANLINGGQLLPEHFHYPHLLYYLSAIVLWVQGLFPEVTSSLLELLYGIEEKGVQPLSLRCLTAALGALTTVPVFLAARRLGGLVAGALAGALIALSPVYNEVAHLAISDVPSGFFAAMTVMFAARLLDGESLGDYLLAGVASGLAAASKYPAGVSALAIVATWIYWRIRQRDFNAWLVWSGAASIATVVAVVPAILFRFDQVLVGSDAPDIMFGFRQYARGGWIGVVVDSNAGYYLRGLADAFGLPALVAGLAGLPLLATRLRWRTLAVLAYPLVFVALLVSMSMVVKRNLQPVLPAAAVVLGIGLSAWPALAARRRPAGQRWVVAGMVLLLVPTAFGVVAWDVSRTRPGTRQLALDWVEANIPHGAGVVKEAYTPDLHPRRYAVRQSRYVARLEVDEILDPRWDFLMLARNAHLRFLSPDRRFKEHHEVMAKRYERLFELELVETFEPGPFRTGPALSIYRVEPDEPVYSTGRQFGVSDITWTSDPALVAEGKKLAFTRRGQSAMFKQYFEPGEYRVAVNPQPAGVQAWLVVVTPNNREIAEIELERGSHITLPDRGKYLLRVFLSPGGVLRRFTVAQVGESVSDGLVEPPQADGL